MPQLVPDTRTAQIAFFKGHLAAWRRAAADLGFTQEEIDAFGDALVGPAADAEFRARVARLAAEAATSEADRLAAKMTTTGRALIARIHAQAKAAGPIGSTGAARWDVFTLDLRPMAIVA